jgi:DNA-binding beta-propeller fold protein YncE
MMVKARIGLALCALALTATGCAVATAAPARPWPGVRTIPGGAFPDALVMSHNGRTLYVGDGYVPGKVWPLDLATGHRGRKVRVRGPAFSLALAPGGRTLFSTNGSIITPVDLVTGKAQASIRMGLAPGGPGGQLLVSRDGRILFFPGEYRIRRYDLATRRFEPDIRADSPWNFLLSGDGTTLWYTSYPSNADAVSLPAGTVTTRLRFNAHPAALALAPNGRTLWAAVPGNHHRPAELIPVSLPAGTHGRGIRITDPVALAMAPDGHHLYLLSSPPGYNGDGPAARGWVTPVNLATRSTGHPIRVGYAPAAIAITPDSKTLYVANTDSQTITIIPVRA